MKKRFDQNISPMIIRATRLGIVSKALCGKKVMEEFSCSENVDFSSEAIRASSFVVR
jgi:hypothetical protein